MSAGRALKPGAGRLEDVSLNSENNQRDVTCEQRPCGPSHECRVIVTPSLAGAHAQSAQEAAGAPIISPDGADRKMRRPRTGWK